ncbi:hypothetical protein AVEN_113560-1 [Araneus ventricosus]|uniref:Uncharacterized protein n=1 Tax=Araneus ventricosus TaxID=182803 RepID=A0A4Y2SFZ2_ARAVE|nr:hypothetical protein AVEN_113560-1 [Araneus ventricosus]
MSARLYFYVMAVHRKGEIMFPPALSFTLSTFTEKKSCSTRLSCLYPHQIQKAKSVFHQLSFTYHRSSPKGAESLHQLSFTFDDSPKKGEICLTSFLLHSWKRQSFCFYGQKKKISLLSDSTKDRFAFTQHSEKVIWLTYAVYESVVSFYFMKNLPPLLHR